MREAFEYFIIIFDMIIISSGLLSFIFYPKIYKLLNSVIKSIKNAELSIKNAQTQNIIKMKSITERVNLYMKGETKYVYNIIYLSS